MFRLLVLLLGVAVGAVAAVPEAPTGLASPTGYVNGTVTLTWNYVPGPQQYLIYFNGGLQASPTVAQVSVSGSTATYAVGGVSTAVLPATVNMRASNSGGLSGYSNSITVAATSGGIPVTVSGTVNVNCVSGCAGTGGGVTYTAAYQGGTWNVGVTNFPASQAVTQGGPFTVSGSVAVSALPSSYLGVSVVSGVAGLTVTATQGSPWTVSGSVAVTGALPAGSNLIGSVSQGSAWTVSGSAEVTNLNSVTITSMPAVVQGSAWTVSGSVLASLSLPAAASGTIAGNGQAVTVTAYGGNGGFVFQFTAGFTGTIVCDISIDGGTTWSQVPFFYGNAAVFTQVISQANPATNAVVIPQTNGAGLCRLRASAYTSGTATIKGVAVSGAGATPWLATQPASQSGTWTVQPGNTANTTPWLVSVSLLGSQAFSVSGPALAAGTTPAGVLKTSGAVLGGVIITSLTTTAGVPTVVHYYNQTFTPTVGAAANQVARCTQVGPGTTECDHGPQGLTFTTGLAYTVTGGLPDTDATVIPAAAAITIEYR